MEESKEVEAIIRNEYSAQQATPGLCLHVGTIQNQVLCLAKNSTGSCCVQNIKESLPNSTCISQPIYQCSVVFPSQGSTRIPAVTGLLAKNLSTLLKCDQQIKNKMFSNMWQKAYSLNKNGT